MIKADPTRAGRCYELAAKFVLENPEWQLVHGSVRTSRKGVEVPDMNHAWCEREGIAYDAVLDEDYAIELFERLFQPKRFAIYSYEGVVTTAGQYNHWGPWHTEENSHTLATPREK